MTWKAPDVERPEGPTTGPERVLLQAVLDWHRHLVESEVGRERHPRRHPVQLDHRPVPARHLIAEGNVTARELRLGDQREVQLADQALVHSRSITSPEVWDHVRTAEHAAARARLRRG